MTGAMPASGFRYLGSIAPRVAITVNGRALSLPDGAPLAAALLAEGLLAFDGSARFHAPRGPLCLMGSCFQCLVTIDGVPNQRACRATVRAGMRIELTVDRI